MQTTCRQQKHTLTNSEEITQTTQAQNYEEMVDSEITQTTQKKRLH